MANTCESQIIVDGPRHVVVKVNGFVDASNMSAVVVNPASLTDYDINGVKATQLRIDEVYYDVEDLLDVELFWDADTPVSIWHFTGRGKVKAKDTGGLINNASTGKNGKITLTTNGYTSGKLSFSLLIKMVKQ